MVVVVVDDGGGEVVVVVSPLVVLVVDDVLEVLVVVGVQLFMFRVSASVRSETPVDRISTSTSTRQSAVLELCVFCVTSAIFHHVELPGPAGITPPGGAMERTL